MHEVISPTVLARWENFYVIVGSAAAALTGLQFVVVALIPQMRMRGTTGGIDAFSTPTIVYFTTVLLLSAVLSAPWERLSSAATLVAACGAWGVGYAALVARRARGQSFYQLVFEDWLWHIALPLVAHAMLLGAGLALAGRPAYALFTIAASALLLLMIGIHNAWDSVTYMVLKRIETDLRERDRQEPPPA